VIRKFWKRVEVVCSWLRFDLKSPLLRLEYYATWRANGCPTPGEVDNEWRTERNERYGSK
jgi:hypothetical protein